MHAPLLLLATTLSCSERVLIQGDIPQGKAWARWSQLLDEASSESGLDYELIDQNRFVLERYLKWVGEHGPGKNHLRESQEDLAMAFLINAFNAAAIYSVIDHRPEDSVLEIDAGLAPWAGGGFWWGQRFRIDGEWINLYYLQEQYIIHRYQSALTYVALNPAIAGAPPVKWWLPDNLESSKKNQFRLDTQLKRHWRSWLATEGGMRQTQSGWEVNKLILDWEDNILEWSTTMTLCEWLTGFTKGERQDWLESQGESCTLESFDTDQSLNRSSPDDTAVEE